MELHNAINFDDLDKYSNVDFSTIIITYNTCKYITRCSYTKLCALIDIFDDVDKLEFDDGCDNYQVFTLAENIIYSIYSVNFNAICCLTENERMRILFKLLQRGFSRFTLYDSGADYNLYKNHMAYLTKYYDTITNLFRLINSDTIDICNLDDYVIGVIKVLLLVAKTRIIPKYVIYHKILLFYL